MSRFKKRSYQKELLDGDDIPFEDIRMNMEELNIINTRLGGHSITVDGFSTLLKTVLARKSPMGSPVIVCEIGCGGGDNLLAIQKWCSKHSIRVKSIGIDIKKECIEFASQRSPYFWEVDWIQSDYTQHNFGYDKPDIIFSSLFCHHFTDEQLIKMLAWMRNNATTGFFINDLHRHSLAYYSIKWITRFFSRSYLVKHDAPLSVLRGFRKGEWEYLLEKAAIKNYKVSWKWAFRYLIVASKITNVFPVSYTNPQQ
jgi:2-polyprenyl-3-methyl-5-hydroxy-6-metoxy-1,4-benzoquinol methylase